VAQSFLVSITQTTFSSGILTMTCTVSGLGVVATAPTYSGGTCTFQFVVVAGPGSFDVTWSQSFTSFTASSVTTPLTVTMAIDDNPEYPPWTNLNDYTTSYV
jgi:hypothetical protein